MDIGAAAAGVLVYIAAAAVFYASLIATAGPEFPVREKTSTNWFS